MRDAYQYAAKAVNCFCITAIGSITAIYSDGVITMPEPIVAGLTVIAATAAVFITENKDA